MLKIHVKDSVAKIGFVSSAEKDSSAAASRGTVFTVEAAWSYAGDVFATFDSIAVTDAKLQFVTAK